MSNSCIEIYYYEDGTHKTRTWFHIALASNEHKILVYIQLYYPGENGLYIHN